MSQGSLIKLMIAIMIDGSEKRNCYVSQLDAAQRHKLRGLLGNSFLKKMKISTMQTWDNGQILRGWKNWYTFQIDLCHPIIYDDHDIWKLAKPGKNYKESLRSVSYAYVSGSYCRYRRAFWS